MIRALVPVLLLILTAATTADEIPNARPASTEADLRAWLENMVWYHQFAVEETAAATGMTSEAIRESLQRFEIRTDNKPARPDKAPILVLPYPGGRHPRIGFLDGAVQPQRETKVSVFLPWDSKSYVVADIPEAIWSNLGLTYLAHTHVPTVWDKQGIKLPPLEWTRNEDGSFQFERTLPNGIRFGCQVKAERDTVRMEQWLHNGTKEPLSDLRVQNCVMLKGAPEFNAQTNDNKVIANPYVTCRNAEGNRWIITAWVPCHRPWGNPPCPCLHSDPKFPDCAPGETVKVHGILTFFVGTDIHAELKRLDQTGWQETQAGTHGKDVPGAVRKTDD